MQQVQYGKQEGDLRLVLCGAIGTFEIVLCFEQASRIIYSYARCKCFGHIFSMVGASKY